MEQKTTGIIATSVTALLCGCPGLFILCVGGVFALVGIVPGSDFYYYGGSNPRVALFTGLGSLCLGVFLVAIPILVGIFTLRGKSEPPVLPDEPIPPAI